MGFVLIIEDVSKPDDEFREYVPYKSQGLHPDKAYVSITKQCRKNNDHNFKYCFSIGSNVAKKSGIETPSMISLAFSEDGFRIRMRQCENGRWKLAFSSLSPHSRSTIVIPESPYEKEIKTSEVVIEKYGDKEIILNIKEAIENYGY